MSDRRGDEPRRKTDEDDGIELAERFTALRNTESAAADVLLDKLGVTSDVDRDIVMQLAGREPLAYPERFGEAHALAMRALEVLDRNGARRVRVSVPKGLGFLRPPAEFVVQLVTRIIVRSFQGTVIDRLRDLYARRLAWCAPGDPSRMALVRARLDTQRATSAYKHKGSGLPTFLVGGVAASSIGSLLRGAASAAGGSAVAAVIATAFIFALLAGASWAILRGAAVARRRIRLTVERPLAALYETIGLCGRPPRDNARVVALYAILLTFVAGLVVPAGVVYVATRL
ncbi:MAG TPA: hypothetical protein VJS45_00755 [Acidimicrobiia bacterium]|nr:hypothetical protein [Acidimicrobiia bacterium]